MSAKLLVPIMRKLSSTSSGTVTEEKAERQQQENRQQEDPVKPQSPAKRSYSLTPTTSCPLSASSNSRSATAGDPVAKDRFQLIFMGSGGVGKSALISRFLYNKFPARYKPTVEDMYATEFPLGHDLFTLELLDTSGTLKFPAMQALNMSRGDGFVLVYSVTDSESFEEVRTLREQILAAKSTSSIDSPENTEKPHVPIVVVGCKVDTPEEERQVSTITAETIVTIDWEHGFVEASALTGEHVSDIFRELLKQSRLNVDIGAVMLDKRRRSFPMCTEAPKRRDFQRKRNSCAIN